MPRIALPTALCLLAATLAPSPSECAVDPLALPQLEPLTIDGSDADWSTRGILVTAFAEDATPPLPRSDVTPELRLGWTESGLALLVTLRSELPWREAADTRTGYQADSVELFLRQGSAWRNLVQAVVTPGLDPDRGEAAFAMWDYRGDPAEWADLPAGIELARAASGEGATLEILIPWAQLRIEPALGTEVEFRINLNKLDAAGNRRQLTWRRGDGDPFQRLRLAAGDTAAIDVDQAAWADAGDPLQLGAAAVAPAARVGDRLSVSQGGTELASAPLVADGERAAVSLWLPRAAIDPDAGGVALTLGGEPIAAADPGDPATAIAHAIERSLLRRGWGGNRSLMARAAPQLPRVLATGDLPQASWPEPALAALAGATALTTQWYDAAGNPITAATTPGRYGAVISVTFAAGYTVRGHHTAALLSEERVELTAAALGVDGADDLRAVLAAGIDQRPALLPALLHAGPYPEEADQHWWHELRAELGTETVYPYGKRLPAGYDEDPERLWPAVIYLHGSGGGVPSDKPPFAERVAASRERDLLGWAGGNPVPFALYALQSNGGWEPPAVIDALERILTEDRIDPDRVIIMGFSMGGMGTWNVATEHAERFAAAVPIACRDGRPDQMHRLGQLPVWIFNGDSDRTTTLDAAQRGEAALKAAGGNVRLTVLPDTGHGGSQNGTFATPGLWEWLAEQRRIGSEATAAP